MVGQGRSLRTQVLVFAGALAYLGWGIADVSLASGFVDPVRNIRPQDEALYSSISIGMAERGEWLTPRFLGRLAFVKPIGAFLPAALSVKALGVSEWSLRLPSLLAGAALLTLLWHWQGWGAMLLVAANPLFFTLARRNMTDVPVLLCVALTIHLWPGRAAVPLALGILIKSVAGAVPLLFLRKDWWRVAGAAAILVAPWHLYQLLGGNGDWYWKEHILDEHLAWGLATPKNVSSESHSWFYGVRAWAIRSCACRFRWRFIRRENDTRNWPGWRPAWPCCGRSGIATQRISFQYSPRSPSVCKHPGGPAFWC